MIEPTAKNKALIELGNRGELPPTQQRAYNKLVANGEIPNGIRRTPKGEISDFDSISGPGKPLSTLPEGTEVMANEFGRALNPRDEQGNKLSTEEFIARDAALGRLDAAMNIPSSTEGRIAAIRKVRPDARFFSSNGEMFLVLDGIGTMALNKKGFSAQDFNDVVISLAIEAPFAVGGAKLFGPSGLGRVTGAGSGAGTGSILRDIAADEIFGTEQGVDFERAGLAALFAGFFEGVTPIAAERLRNLFRSNFFFNRKTAQLTDEGKDALRGLGIDPDELTDDALKELEKQLSFAETPGQALGIAQANSLPKAVPLSKGDITRNVSDQSLEEAAKKGGVNEQSRVIAQTFDDSQQQALRQNIDEVQSIVGTGDSLTPSQGAAQVQDALSTQAQQLKTSVGQAYDDAIAKSTTVVSEGVNQLHKNVMEVFQRFNVNAAKKTFDIVKQLKIGGNIKEVKIKALENVRSQLATLSRSNDTVEAAASSAAKRQFDDYMDNLIEETMIRGDKDALKSFMTARGLRKEYAIKFESNNIIKSLIETNNGQLKLTPEEALNKIFTANSLSAKSGGTRALQEMKVLLGEDSPAWKSLKEEGFLRLISSQGRGGVRSPTLERILSGDKLSSSLDSALTNHPALMKTLYSKSEIKLFKQLSRVMLIATNKVSGAVNTSNTSFKTKVIQAFEFPFMSSGIKALVRGTFKSHINANATRQVKALFEPIPKKPNDVGAGAAIGVGAQE